MMADGRGWRWGLVSLVAVVLLILGCIVGFEVAVGILKDKVIQALGPDSEIKEKGRVYFLPPCYISMLERGSKNFWIYGLRSSPTILHELRRDSCHRHPT
jgi:hypothetical protein